MGHFLAASEEDDRLVHCVWLKLFFLTLQDALEQNTEAAATIIQASIRRYLSQKNFLQMEQSTNDPIWAALNGNYDPPC